MPASFLQSGHAPEQGSMRAILQSCLECLDKLNGTIDHVHEESLRLEIMEVHAHFTELLAQSQITVDDSSRQDSSVDIQEIGRDGTQTIIPLALVEPGAIALFFTPPDHFYLLQPLAVHGQFLDEEYDPLGSVRVMGLPPEPGGQLSQGTLAMLSFSNAYYAQPDLLLHSASGLISYGLSTQPFLTQHSMYSEGHTLPGCSARNDQ
ncbi:hypothetical protein BDR04DRAFT_1121212 [Suillus decipiens]|nr:hypothetical protein BDR04DRAFT_1121212 [Suillus decipiens]